MVSKLDLILVAAALAAGLLVVESGHRTELVPPAAAAEVDRCASADLRYAAGRLAFFEGGFVAGVDRRRLAERFSYPPECGR
jgi:hypothetical protein